MARRGSYGDNGDIGDVSELNIHLQEYLDAQKKAHGVTVAYGRAEQKILEEALAKRASMYRKQLEQEQSLFESHIENMGDEETKALTSLRKRIL